LVFVHAARPCAGGVEQECNMQASTLQAGASGRIRNAMTIDVEDYFQVSAFAPHIPRESWNGMD
jgi:hypothetical protein